jgi:hypothetical protein
MPGAVRSTVAGAHTAAGLVMTSFGAEELTITVTGLMVLHPVEVLALI